MSTKVEKTVLVNVPLSMAYDQWTQFEDFPRFMGGVESVTQLEDDRLQWVAEIGGVRRQWEARVLEQVPSRRISWAATQGATNAGTVEFDDAGPDQTSVYLVLEYEPEGWVEKIGDAVDVVENQAERDLGRFKEFIEARGHATGAWRGTVNDGAGGGTPGVESTVDPRADAGKAGVSGDAVAVGAGGVAAAAAAGAAVVAGKTRDTGKKPATIEAPRSEQTDSSTDVLDAAEKTGAATDPITPTEASTAYDAAPGPASPVPPTGSVEDLVSSIGAARAGVDHDIPEQPLEAEAPAGEGLAPEAGTPTEPPTAYDAVSPSETPAENRKDTPLREEPALLEDTPPMVAPDVASVDVTPPEGEQRGVDPITGQLVEDDRSTGGAP